MPTPSIVIALYMFTFIDALGCAMVLSALPFLILDLGINPTWIMASFASYSFGQVLGMPCLGLLSDHLGHKPSLVLVLAGSAMSFCGLSFAHSVQELVILRGFHGLMNGSMSLCQICILYLSAPGHRGECLGRLSAAMTTGASIGAALGTWLFALKGFERVASTASAVCGMNAFMCGIGFVELSPRAWKMGEAHRVQENLRQRLELGPCDVLGMPGIPAIYGATFLHMFGLAAVDAMIAIYAHELYEIGATQMGVASAISGFGCLMFQACWMQSFMESVGDRGGFILGHFARACLYVGLIIRVPSWCAVILFVMGTVGGQIATTCAAALLGCHAPAHLIGVAVGLQHAIGAIGRLLGPTLAGAGYSLDHCLPLILALAASVLAVIIGSCLSASSGALQRQHTSDSDRRIVQL